MSTTPTSTRDFSKHDELQATIHSLRKELELQSVKILELTANLDEAGHQTERLEREKEECKAENGELLQNYSRLQSSVNELQTRVQEQESKALLKTQQDNELQALRKALSGNGYSNKIQ